MMESDMGTGLFQSSTIGEDFSCPTPEQKLGLQKAASHGDMSLSSGSASSDLSPKEGSAVSSSLTPSSESESESEFYVKRRVIQELKITKFGATEIEAMVEDSMNEKMKDNMYKSLLEKVSKYERELEFANKVIMTSQEEISRLRSELAESPTVTGVSKNLYDQFEASCFDVTKLEDNGTKVLELQNTIARLEASLQDSDQSNAMLTEELRITKERLQTSENKIYEVTHEMQHQINSTNEVVRCLETELASERWTTSELQARVVASANERSDFLSDISVLSKQHKATQTKLDQAESRVKLLEDQVGQSILEKLEIRDSLEAQEKQFQADINQLKTELLGKLEDGEGMATELRLKVAKLEKEAAMQKDVILDRAEEKREVIRQLCFSLEYYRSEYHQLCRAFSGLKRHPLAVQ